MMVRRRPPGIYTVPTMADASKPAASAEENKGRISNLMDSVMTASRGRSRILVLMDAVMKASKADADFSEEACISHDDDSYCAKDLKQPNICEEEEACISHGDESYCAKDLEWPNLCEETTVLAEEGRRGVTRARVHKWKVSESRQQQQETALSFSPPTFTKTVLAGSVAASHGSGIWIPLEFMKDHGHQIGNEAVLQDECGKKWEVSVSRGSWSGFRAGWKKFADNHVMVVGDNIEFTLVGDSMFAVRILCQRQQPVPDPRHDCEDSHKTEHKGISRKRSTRHISSKSKNQTSEGGNSVKDEAEVVTIHHQFHAATTGPGISNRCKRARSKRFRNHKRDSRPGEAAAPQPAMRNPRLLQDNCDTKLEYYPSTRSKARQAQDNKAALMYNSSAANKLRALVEIFEEEYQRTHIDVVYSQRSFCLPT